MRHGSARKVLLFVALVALGTVIGIVLTRPARPHTVYLSTGSQSSRMQRRRRYLRRVEIYRRLAKLDPKPRALSVNKAVWAEPSAAAE
jgi:hypothetical protein